MAQSMNYDIDSIGSGGGLGGFGFGNNNPLLWLITLGFLKGENGILGGGGGNAGAAGVLAGETQAKLDCLAQQHQTLSDQITNDGNVARFQAVSNQISNLEGISRDNTAAITNTLNDIRADAAECCCETKIAIQGVNTAIAQQTAVLTASGLANTQAILDRINASELATKDSEIRRLQDDLQTQTILANCNGGSGNGVDINVLAAALGRGVQVNQPQ